jgi:endonuclease-3
MPGMMSNASTPPATSKSVASIVSRLAEEHPDAKLALDFSSPLELLVALILAAQARDDLVNAVTPAVFKKYKSAADWATEAEPVLQEQLKKINFYRNKTKAIQKACAVLVERHNGQVPDRLEDLLELPGVGRKTANIILGNAFGQDAVGVDTHVLRLSQRMGFTRHVNPDKAEADLVALVPKAMAVKFCHLLQFHGRRVCTAKHPECDQCAVNRLCPKIGVTGSARSTARGKK